MDKATGCIGLVDRVCGFFCLLFLFVTLHPMGAQNEDGGGQPEKGPKATLDAMVTALGGQRWLTLTSTMQQGRTSGFYQGKPTGMTAEFYEIQKFPDQTRVELGKKRDVVEIISGDQAWEITYKGKKNCPKTRFRILSGVATTPSGQPCGSGSMTPKPS